jgi:hypothetical protein
MNIEEDGKKGIKVKVQLNSGKIFVGNVNVKKGMLASVALKSLINKEHFFTLISEGEPVLVNALSCESIKILSE